MRKKERIGISGEKTERIRGYNRGKACHGARESL